MTARSARKDGRALKHGYERTQVLTHPIGDAKVDERSQTGKLCSQSSFSARVGICSTAVRRKVLLAKEFRASPLLEATWTRCDLEANPPVNSARSTWAPLSQCGRRRRHSAADATQAEVTG